MKLYVNMETERMPLQIRTTGRGFDREILQVRIPGDTITRGGPPSAADNGQQQQQQPQQHRPSYNETTTTTTFNADTRPDHPAPNPRIAVDREKVCPFLLRVFNSVGRRYNVAEFMHGNTPDEQLAVYTWKDATLKELSSLVRSAHPDARLRDTFFEFSLVFPDFKSSHYRSRHIGTTRNGMKGQDDNKTLADVGFQIGNYLTVQIIPPNHEDAKRF